MIRPFWHLLGLLLLACLTLPLSAQTGGPGFREGSGLRLAGVDAAAVPGVAWAVVERGEVTELGARGVKRTGSDDPVTADTPFLIGSISKSFTALAVMQLAEAGKLSYDDPVGRYLPAFADRPAGRVTIRQLLSHTSGFSTFQGHFAEEALPGEPDAIAARAARLAATEPMHAAGEAWEYSNANYQVLGRLVEVLGGQPFGRYVETQILQPVGMADSFVADGRVHPAMATGHTPWFGAKRPLGDTRTDPGTAPQGGVVASARDLGRYMLMLMNGRSDVVSARAKAMMMEPAGEVSPFYGFGWFLDRQSGTVGHSGASPGFTALMTLMPAQGKGVVVLVNATSGIGFGETAALLDGITAAALDRDYAGTPGRWGQKATFLFLVLLPPAFLASMVWAWRHRDALRAKSGAFGLFSLWFPLITTLAAAWLLLFLVPRLFGLPLGTLRLFQPDLHLAMVGTAVAGVLWALLRLAFAYTGRAS